MTEPFCLPGWKRINGDLQHRFHKKERQSVLRCAEGPGHRALARVRLHNTSQLAGFAKQSDLSHFLSEICGASYEHEPLLAPTKEILNAFKKHKGSWDVHRGLPVAPSIAKGRSRAFQRGFSQEDGIAL
ncbi:MAG: DUF488 family protein [Terracidiphilus sp.]